MIDANCNKHLDKYLIIICADPLDRSRVLSQNSDGADQRAATLCFYCINI